MADVETRFKFQPFGPHTGLNLVMLLERKSLFLPRKSVLNDPTDCEPYVVVEEDRDSLIAALLKVQKYAGSDTLYSQRAAALQQKLGATSTHTRAKRKAPAVSPPGTLFTWDDPISAAATLIKSFIKTRIGTPRIFSMSARWDITQMWSYYADAHKGFCIELSGFDGDDAGIILDRVNYTDRRAQILLDDALAISGRTAQAKRTISTIYCEKSNAWRDEVEYRLVARENLVGKDRIELSLPSGEFYRFPNLKVHSISFGLRCEKYNADTVKAIISEYALKSSDVELFDVHQSNNSYDLTRSEISSTRRNAVRAWKDLVAPSAQWSASTVLEYLQNSIVGRLAEPNDSGKAAVIAEPTSAKPAVRRVHQAPSQTPAPKLRKRRLAKKASA